MRTPTETVREFVAAFVAAWPKADAAAVERFFSVDAAYRNGPLEPAVGRPAIVRAIGEMMQLGGEVGVDLVHVVDDGPIVMTERVDHWTDGEQAAQLRAAGIFEVHAGLITAWRDYFDLAEFSLQVARPH